MAHPYARPRADGRVARSGGSGGTTSHHQTRSAGRNWWLSGGVYFGRVAWSGGASADVDYDGARISAYSCGRGGASGPSAHRG